MSNYRKPRGVSIPDSLWSQVEAEAAATGRSRSQVVIHALSQYFQSKVQRHSSWETDDSDAWYDENKFYTFSQDKFGHSARIEVTVPKMIAGEIAGIVDSGAIPELRTAQDFYRNAVRHQAYRTGKMLADDTLVAVSHQMTTLDRIATSQAAATEYDELESRTRDLLDEEIVRGHLFYVREELDNLWDSTSSINERFRDRFVALLKEYEEKLSEAIEVDYKTVRGTVTYPDGRRFKNGIELAPKKTTKPRRRKGS